MRTLLQHCTRSSCRLLFPPRSMPAIMVDMCSWSPAAPLASPLNSPGLNRRIRVAIRSSEKIIAAIKTIKSQVRTKTGRVESLRIGLAYLALIEKSLRDVLSKGDRSNVLVHNSGLIAPASSKMVDFGEHLQQYPCFHRHPTRSTYLSLH